MLWWNFFQKFCVKIPKFCQEYFSCVGPSSIRTVWRGIHPEIGMQEVTLLDRTGQFSCLKIQELKIGINIFSSLMHRRFVVSEVVLSGMHLQIRRVDPHTLDINGVSFPLPSSGTFSVNSNPIIQWLMGQGRITLQNIDVDWTDEAGRLYPLTQLDAILNNASSDHQIAGTAILLAKTPTQLQFAMHATQTGAKKNSIKADCYVSIQDFDLTHWIKKETLPMIKVGKATLNHLQLWAIWDHNEWQLFQTLFDLREAHLKPRTERPSHSSELIVPGSDYPIHIDQLAANLVWQREGNGFNLVAHSIKLSINRALWPVTQLQIWKAPDAHGNRAKIYPCLVV